MGKLINAALMIGLTVLPSVTLANEPKGGPPDYSGISGLYYSIIALILGYGVYDTFFKKS